MPTTTGCTKAPKKTEEPEGHSNGGESGLWWLAITLLGSATLIRIADTFGFWTLDRFLESILAIGAIITIVVCVYIEYQKRRSARNTQSSPEERTTPRKPIPSGLFRVYKVIDGDTIQTINNAGVIEDVRLIGIDAPESVHPDKLKENWGSEASAALVNKLIGNDRVEWTIDETAFLVGRPIFRHYIDIRLTNDGTQGLYDKYDRLLAYIWLEDGTLVNEWLVQEGHAREWTFLKPCKHRDRLLAAEAEARQARRGMWAN